MTHLNLGDHFDRLNTLGIEFTPRLLAAGSTRGSEVDAVTDAHWFNPS
jgi:hypothetical protein